MPLRLRLRLPPPSPLPRLDTRLPSLSRLASRLHPLSLGCIGPLLPSPSLSPPTCTPSCTLCLAHTCPHTHMPGYMTLSVCAPSVYSERTTISIHLRLLCSPDMYILPTTTNYLPLALNHSCYDNCLPSTYLNTKCNVDFIYPHRPNVNTTEDSFGSERATNAVLASSGVLRSAPAYLHVITENGSGIGPHHTSVIANKWPNKPPLGVTPPSFPFRKLALEAVFFKFRSLPLLSK